mgnify:CR=1 FL=1
MKYAVIYKYDTNCGIAIYNLQKEINEYIEKGWIPQGGISIAMGVTNYENKKYVVTQAMIKNV